jgi:hypothetical protein
MMYEGWDKQRMGWIRKNKPRIKVLNCCGYIYVLLLFQINVTINEVSHFRTFATVALYPDPELPGVAEPNII